MAKRLSESPPLRRSPIKRQKTISTLEDRFDHIANRFDNSNPLVLTRSQELVQVDPTSMTDVLRKVYGKRRTIDSVMWRRVAARTKEYAQHSATLDKIIDGIDEALARGVAPHDEPLLAGILDELEEEVAKYITAINDFVRALQQDAYQRPTQVSSSVDFPESYDRGLHWLCDIIKDYMGDDTDRMFAINEFIPFAMRYYSNVFGGPESTALHIQRYFKENRKEIARVCKIRYRAEGGGTIRS